MFVVLKWISLAETPQKSNFITSNLPNNAISSILLGKGAIHVVQGKSFEFFLLIAPTLPFL